MGRFARIDLHRHRHKESQLGGATPPGCLPPRAVQREKVVGPGLREREAHRSEPDLDEAHFLDEGQGRICRPGRFMRASGSVCSLVGVSRR